MIVIKRKALVSVNLYVSSYNFAFAYLPSPMFLPDLCQEDYPLQLKLDMVDWRSVSLQKLYMCLAIIQLYFIRTFSYVLCSVEYIHNSLNLKRKSRTEKKRILFQLKKTTSLTEVSNFINLNMWKFNFKSRFEYFSLYSDCVIFQLSSDLGLL